MQRRTLALLVAFSGFTSSAHADIGDWESNYDPGTAERRSAFAAGASLAAAFGTVTGYPNEVNKIGDPEFEASTGAAGGSAAGLWAGVALRDFLVIGLGTSFSSVAGGEGSLSRGGAFILHVEAFPAFYRGGIFRDLAVVGEFGVGSRNVLMGSREAADGGLVSFAAGGILYEPIRIGDHLSAGPLVLVNHQFSENLRATFATVGMQLSFYGGPK